ncbi:MAG TPA: hypothetical protein VEQ10_19645 [Vicinamibacteria bacterium]|nr:hypothetical protein [Vicinamibacteria bacterium]
MTLAAIDALAGLRRLGKPVFTTADASLSLGLRRPAATRALSRLARAGLVAALRRGLWSLETDIDPLRLPEALTSPHPSYLSLQTALHLHGMITQVPQVIFVASLAPTRTVATRVGVFSIHRLGPSFFGGFETTPDGIRLATAEKALLDTLYLAPARSRAFAALPEVEIPNGFDRAEARRWISRIRSGPRRRLVEARLLALLAAGGTGAGRGRRLSAGRRRSR